MNLRKLWAWEREQLRAHLLRLGPEDRAWRFCHPVSNDGVHRYCDAIDWPRTTVVGCFADGALRGVAELVRLPNDSPVGAEVALSVEVAYQRRGIGARLLQKALLLARNRFIDTVHMLSLRENVRIQGLVRRFGASVISYASVAEGSIHLPWPSHVSLLEEFAGDGQALIGAVFELPVDELAGGTLQAAEPGWPR
jgi:GNAT superfamily N-acetyltransferase